MQMPRAGQRPKVPLLFGTSVSIILRAYPLTFTSCHSWVARAGEFTTRRPRQDPVAGGKCLSLEAHPSSSHPSSTPRTPRPLICPSLPKSLPSALKRKVTFLSLIFKALLCDTLPPSAHPRSWPALSSYSSLLYSYWATVVPHTMQLNSLPRPSSKKLFSAPPQTSATLYPCCVVTPQSEREPLEDRTISCSLMCSLYATVC